MILARERFKGVFELTHPLARTYLSIIRDKKTPEYEFRRNAKLLSSLLVMAASYDLKMKKIKVKTPLGMAGGTRISSQIIVIPILRAGMSLLDAILDYFREVNVGIIGLYRNEKTLQAVQYYMKLPPRKTASPHVFLIDPMLATGNTAASAIIQVKRMYKSPKIKFLCLVSARKGINKIREVDPGVKIYTVAVDPKLNKKGYIIPGLGDAGDRIFATQ